MWRAGVLLLPLSLIEIYRSGLEWRTDIVLVHLYCVVGGGVAPFAIWNHALTRWRTSQVLLFNNLIPLTTMTWARLTLKEPIMPTFWIALCLVVAGVVLGQVRMPSSEASAPVPPE
jgi:drug/metabolite transporter (DMT)-like permease